MKRKNKNRPSHFQAGCRKRRLILALVSVFILSCTFLLIGECVLLLCWVLFFHTKPRDWLWNVSEMTYFVMSGT